MVDDFKYDVFLSHSSKDTAVVRDVAERLRGDGLRVWFDEWEIKPRARKATREKKIEAALEHSRVLVLCMSAHAFGSDWAQLEAGTFRFRDPLNQERRFIPLRLDDAPVRGSLEQFLYVNWRQEKREQEYANLLEACQPPAKALGVEAEATSDQIAEKIIQLNDWASITNLAFSPDRRRVLAGCQDKMVRMWEVETGRCLCKLEGHTEGELWGLAWSADSRRALSGSRDKTMRLWDLETGRCVYVFGGHSSIVIDVAWSDDQRYALSGAHDKTVRLWEVETGRCLRVFRGHTSFIWTVAWSIDQRRMLSGDREGIVRLWDVDTGGCLHVLEGHTRNVFGLAWRADGRRVLSAGSDKTVRLWDIETGHCLRVLEGHTASVWSLAWHGDQRLTLSGSSDSTVRLWDVETGRCLRVLKGHTAAVRTVAWSADGRRAFSGDSKGGIRVWDLSEFVAEAGAPEAPATALPSLPDQVQYTNAKVLLVGETGAGKTGLSKRLALDDWQPSDSTVGVAGEADRFRDEELKAVIGLLAGPGAVWELKFGSWVLLQPERINAGIDMEIEFKDDDRDATGRMLFLQLKSGDSYLRSRKRDGSEVFQIKETRHAKYWRELAFPVLLVIRTSDGEVRWMEIRDYLKRESDDGKKAVKQIVFEGERFDVMSVRRWREKALAG